MRSFPSLEPSYRPLTLPPNPQADGDGQRNLEEWLHEMAAELENVTPKDSP
jgi:hypothetical protein